MQYVTPDLCDAYPELVQVVEPMFSNFGGHDSFGGEIVTIKCFEDNSLVKDQVDLDGKGKVAVAIGAVAPTPLRLKALETAINEKGLSGETILWAADAIN